MTRADIHHHVWTAPLLDALAARRSFPFVDRSDEVAVLHSAGGRPYIVDVAAESAPARSRRLAEDGVDLAVVAISSPIGIEALDHEIAMGLIATHLDGVLALGDGFAADATRLPSGAPGPIASTADGALQRESQPFEAELRGEPVVV